MWMVSVCVLWSGSVVGVYDHVVRDQSGVEGGAGHAITETSESARRTSWVSNLRWKGLSGISPPYDVRRGMRASFWVGLMGWRSKVGG